MTQSELTQTLLACYPQIYFACHTRHTRDPLTQQKVSQRQVSILDHLDSVEATAVTELAGHMGVTPSTISLAVDRLERRGYVVRMRDVADGRRVLLRLTDDGLRVRQAHSVLDPSRVAELLGELDPRQQDSAIQGLKLLAEAARRMMEKRSRHKAWARRSNPLESKERA